MPEDTGLELLRSAFARNTEVNATVFAALTEADLSVADGRGGWSIGQHLGHVVEFRYGWLSVVSPEHAEGIPSVAETDRGQLVLTTTSLPDLAAASAAGDGAISAAVGAARAEGRAFERAYGSDPAHLLVHTLVHDAHHRGQIMALLRATGSRTREQLDALEQSTWAIWRR